MRQLVLVRPVFAHLDFVAKTLTIINLLVSKVTSSHKEHRKAYSPIPSPVTGRSYPYNNRMVA